MVLDYAHEETLKLLQLNREGLLRIKIRHRSHDSLHNALLIVK